MTCASCLASALVGRNSWKGVLCERVLCLPCKRGIRDTKKPDFGFPLKWHGAISGYNFIILHQRFDVLGAFSIFVSHV